MVKFVEKAHEVVGDPAPRRMLADDVALHVVISSRPAMTGNARNRAVPLGCFGDGQVRQSDLFKASNVHGPEHIAPCLVQWSVV